MAFIFLPGQSKTAKVPITVTPAGMPCTAELFLGVSETVKAASSGHVSFTSTGTEQIVTLPVNMPTVAGQYHVYADVDSNGYVLAAIQGLDDVIIPSAVIGPPVWS
jgi:hypothetical protein